MSCHTYAYKRIDTLTQSEKDKYVSEAIKDASNWWGFKISKDKLIEHFKGMYETNPDIFNVKSTGKPETYAEKTYEKFAKLLEDLKTRGFDAWLEQNKDEHPICAKYNGVYYVNIGFDIPFRIFEYPDDNHYYIVGKDELLGYLKSLDPYEIGYYDNGIFFDGYNEELVK